MSKEWFRVEHYGVVTRQGKLVHRFRTLDLSKRVCKELNHEIKAALAEREKVTTDDSKFDEITQLRQQLATERDENWRHAYDNLLIDYHERQKQLLQAQAATALIRDRCEKTRPSDFMAQDIISWCKSVNQSALDKHDRDQWKLLIDGQHRAICGKCGYPELVGSDDCRNCSSNFNQQIGYGKHHDAGKFDDLMKSHERALSEQREKRKPLVDALEVGRDYLDTLCNPNKRPTGRTAREIRDKFDDALAKVKEDGKK
jgi:hypothetical protein